MIVLMPAATYREEPCRSALNRVKGMPFAWSLNPYVGCVHRCTFCYVRGFELRADRPADDRYGRSIRVKTNVAQVLRSELARRSWRREEVTIGAATDPYQPAEGRYRLTRACIVELAASRTPISIITRGPMIWRDVDALQEAASRAEVSVNVSIPTLDERVWRTTEPGTAPPRSRLEIVRRLVDAGIRTNVAIAPILPGLSDGAEQLAEDGARSPLRGCTPHLGERPLPPPRHEGAFPRIARARLARGERQIRGAVRRPVVFAGHDHLAADRIRASPGTRACGLRTSRHSGPGPSPTQLTLV